PPNRSDAIHNSGSGAGAASSVPWKLASACWVNGTVAAAVAGGINCGPGPVGSPPEPDDETLIEFDSSVMPSAGVPFGADAASLAGLALVPAAGLPDAETASRVQPPDDPIRWVEASTVTPPAKVEKSLMNCWPLAPCATSQP